MIEVCRTDGHEWDEEPIGLMFLPVSYLATQTSTCLRCGVQRTYGDGRVTWTYPTEQNG